MPFLTKLRYEEVGNTAGRPRVRLTEDLVYKIGNLYNAGVVKNPIVVPTGFEFDFYTTPRFLWSIFPQWDKKNRPACLHDYLCKHGTCSQFLKDALFWEAMLDDDVPRWKRGAKYYGVRLKAIVTLTI